MAPTIVIADLTTKTQLRNILSDRSQLPFALQSWMMYLDTSFGVIANGKLDSFRNFFRDVDDLCDIDKKALNDLAPYLFTALFANDYTPLPNRSDEELLRLIHSGVDLAGILLQCRQSRKHAHLMRIEKGALSNAAVSGRQCERTRGG
jgi:hypothetical protein